MNSKNLLINGVVEDNKLHVKMTGNPADMVTHLIGIINGTLESIADCLMYDAGNYPECKDEFFVCAANFLIGYDEAIRLGLVREDNPSNDYIDSILSLIDTEAIKRAKDLENCCEAQDVNCVKKELDSNEAGTRGDNNE